MISLDDAKAEMDGWLALKLKTGKCSQLVRDQLAEGWRCRTIGLFAVFDEIGQMEGSDRYRPTGTKRPGPLKRDALCGLMHKPYRVSSLTSFALNQRNHWRSKNGKKDLAEIVSKFCHDGHVAKLVHELVLGAHKKRHGTNEVTGEWIVYVKVAGVHYYLTLATHDEPDTAVASRVRACFAEFPEVALQLGW